jgi:outer membrane lipoprotein-sorting protein
MRKTKLIVFLFFFYIIFFIAQANTVVAQNKGTSINSKKFLAVKQINAYLNEIKTLRADFLQIATNGEIASGKLYMSRPGKIRFEYTPPSPILIISDGTFLIYIDKHLEGMTHFFLSNSPISFLVKKSVRITDDTEIISFSQKANIIRIKLAKLNQIDKGTITLNFTNQPFNLRKWVVADPQGVETTVILSNMEKNITLNPELFEFEGFPKKE